MQGMSYSRGKNRTQGEIDMDTSAMWNFALLPEMLNEYLTTEEAAQVLKVGKSTLEQLRISGNGPMFRRFGTRIRYQMGDLDQWGEKYSSTSEYKQAA
jgi:excisionase family DNA binding protein